MSRSSALGAADRNNTVWVAAGLALGPAVVLGLARFAYALLLPSMRDELHWSLGTAGAMNSANALGYLAGALATARLARRHGARRSFIVALGVTVVSLLATAATEDTVVLLGLRTLAGVCGAVAFIAGAGLVAEVAAGATAHRAAMLLGIYFAGGGAGIVISGLSVPALLAAMPTSAGWRWGWVLLGALGVVALVPAWLAARASSEPPPPPHHDRRWPARHFVAMLGSYALFGAGYIAYMTFIVAFLHDGGAGTGEITAFWAVLGTASILGAFCWVRPITRLRGGRGASIVLAVVAAGAILPLVSRAAPIAMASAVLFGGSFLAVVTSVTAVARRSLPPHHWTPAIAALTVVFAAGQCVGPVLTGVLSEGPAGLRIGLGVSAGLLVAAALTVLGQRHLEAGPGRVVMSLDVSVTE
ncbi:MAG: YbfB/YjiJ family MFS transporter [Actinomycetes bacterium]